MLVAEPDESQAHIEPSVPPANQLQPSQVAAGFGLRLSPVKIKRPTQTPSLSDPIQLPSTPSGFPQDNFALHKPRLEPIRARLAPIAHAPAPAWPLGLSLETRGGAEAGLGQNWSETSAGPVTEGAEALVDAVSDVGSSDAEASDQSHRWGMLQAAKRALFRRKSQVGSAAERSPGGSAASGTLVPGHAAPWDVSHTKGSQSTFSIGSGSHVQHSTGSMSHLGSQLGLQTYSPLSHQGSLLRKDVDNQKNIRQADLNAVKRTPLSLKVSHQPLHSRPID